MDSNQDIVLSNKILKAKTLKHDGNDFFKRKEYKKAVRSYHSSLLYLKGIHCDIVPKKPFPGRNTVQLSAEDRAEVDSLTADVYNNLAACLMKQDPVPNERIVTYCTEVTSRQPENMKALYRLGLAHYNLKDNSKALDALKQANRIAEGKDAVVRKLLNAVEQELRKEDQKFKEMFKNSLLATKT